MPISACHASYGKTTAVCFVIMRHLFPFMHGGLEGPLLIRHVQRFIAVEESFGHTDFLNHGGPGEG
jgi:hypothetical protein